MNALNLIQEVTRAGATMTLEGGDLVLSGARPLPDDLVSNYAGTSLRLSPRLRRVSTAWPNSKKPPVKTGRNWSATRTCSRPLPAQSRHGRCASTA